MVGLLLAMAVYLALITQRAVLLLADPGLVAKLLGGSVLVFPVLGCYVVVQELRFGAATARLARSIDPQVLAGDDAEAAALARTASGRVMRADADALFARRQAQLAVDPDNPQQWYRLAVAYDLAGDRRRARRTMRHAIAIGKQPEQQRSVNGCRRAG